MKKFESYSKFINHLLVSIKACKRIAIFEEPCDGEEISYLMGTLENENKDKYVHYFVPGKIYDLNELACSLIKKFSDEYSITFNWEHMYHEDGTDDIVHVLEIDDYMKIIDNRKED